MRLHGKVAVITGAASGIGRAAAELFAREGAVVVAVDLNPELSTDPPAGCAMSVVCDVADLSQVEQMSRRVREELGRYDILVASAGRVVFGTTAECTVQDWEAAFAVNAKGVWVTCRCALPYMLERGEGAVVNIASGAGVRPVAGLAAYSASKAAVISITRSIALEYSSRGIRANCICPGMIDTPMNQAAVAQRLAGGEDAASLLAPYAIKRLGRPEEVAAVALFLASPEASYVTGAALAVDAGRTLH